jgi:penicillin amidase
MLSLILSACKILFTRKVSMDARLTSFPVAELPLERPVRIYWNDNQVPFIDAQGDRDLALALGMVHAHLRGAQIAVLKRLATGRLSEMVGPFAVDIDHALRALDFGGGAQAQEYAMPEESRVWVQSFVDGLNCYHALQPRLPPEFALLGLKPEPYTVRDALTIGRLAAADVNWLLYFGLLREGSPDAWPRLLRAGAGDPAAARRLADEPALARLLSGAGRLGSNAVAVSASRSASGSALLAADTHLGLTLPNFWLLAGMHSPSYHAVGMMIPGVPVIGVGRNPDLAWSGTNLHAASSDLYDVSALPAERFHTARVRIGVRFWADRHREIRRTAFGPVITDSRAVPRRASERLALRWVGQEPTDELTALLKVARASSGEQFREALRSFGVPGQNMVFADRGGRVGLVVAAVLPVRSGFSESDPVLDARDPSTHWKQYARTPELPLLVDPAEGFVASANNRPPQGRVPVGFFFSSEERVHRLREQLRSQERIGLDALRRLQFDVVSPVAAGLAGALVAQIDQAHAAERFPAFLSRLKEWDGSYDAASGGAVGFETLLCHVASALYERKPGWLQSGFAQWALLSDYLIPDLQSLPAERRAALLRESVARAARDCARYRGWGEMHRLRVAHFLYLLPVIGSRFVLRDLPAGGSRETVMKTAHDLVRGRHYATYGSQARFLTDLGDLDANYFVLFGGQDGWLGSSTFDDQVHLWRSGEYMRLPLRLDSVAREFRRMTTLSPAQPEAADPRAQRR